MLRYTYIACLVRYKVMPISDRQCHDCFSIMLVNHIVDGKAPRDTQFENLCVTETSLILQDALCLISLGGFVRIAVNFTVVLSLWLCRKFLIPLIVSLLKLFIYNRAMCEVLDDLLCLILIYDCEIYNDNDLPTRAAENTKNSSHK